MDFNGEMMRSMEEKGKSAEEKENVLVQEEGEEESLISSPLR